MGVAMFQDLVTGSLRDLQASHQRELAVLHEENLRLLDKLADRGKAAGKSLAGVVEVATKVPRIPCLTGVLEVANKVPRISSTTKPRPVVDSTIFAASTSIDVAVTATAGPQPAASPCSQVQMPWRARSRIASSSTERLTSVVSQS